MTAPALGGGEPAPTPPFDRSVRLIGLGLALCVLVLYARTHEFGFIHFDDPYYVYQNPNVTGGLTTEGVQWAFTKNTKHTQHTLTWLSHMLDWQLYGKWAGGHHLTSVLLQAATVVALFLALVRLTGDRWCSAAVAVLWAVHPLRVESVVWVSERKDVLSGLFFCLALLAYAGYARRPTLRSYLGVAGLLALGLMAKPMLVTVPCVLLLLDYWPLNRFGPGAPPGESRKAVIEKLPLLALAALVSVVTVIAQRQGGAVESIETIPLSDRVENAVVSYVVYLVQSAYPADLAVYYPPSAIPNWKILGSVAVLLGVTVGVVILRRSHPYLGVGWFWYLGMLVPVIGIVKVGTQAHADRYTHLPQIGILIAVVWGVRGLVSTPRAWMPRMVVAVVVVLGVLTWRQTSHWKDSVSLFTHTLACTKPHAIPHFNLGCAYLDIQNTDEALKHFQEAWNLDPNTFADPNTRKALVDLHLQRGNEFAKQGKLPEAVADFRHALEVEPDDPAVRRTLATLNVRAGLNAARRGRPADAVVEFRNAIQADPTFGAAYNNLGAALLQLGKPNEAVECFQRALELDPQDVNARKNLNALLAPR